MWVPDSPDPRATTRGRPYRYEEVDGIHRPYAAIYADTAARVSASGFGNNTTFQTFDLYKKVLQLDTASEWILTSISPVTWAQTNAGGGGSSIFGQDAQYVEDMTENSTGSTTWQTKLELIVPGGRNGIYRISWSAQVGQSNTQDKVEAKLYNVTDAVDVGLNIRIEPKDSSAWYSVGDFALVNMAGQTKTFAIQYREQDGSSARIRAAKIEFWRWS